MMLESYSSHLCPCAVEVSSSSNTLQSRNVFDAIAVKILVFAEIIGRLQLLKGKVVTALTQPLQRASLRSRPRNHMVAN